jgi:hypothetical protein
MVALDVDPFGACPVDWRYELAPASVVGHSAPVAVELTPFHPHAAADAKPSVDSCT